MKAEPSRKWDAIIAFGGLIIAVLYWIYAVADRFWMPGTTSSSTMEYGIWITLIATVQAVVRLMPRR